MAKKKKNKKEKKVSQKTKTSNAKKKSSVNSKSNSVVKKNEKNSKKESEKNNKKEAPTNKKLSKKTSLKETLKASSVKKSEENKNSKSKSTAKKETSKSTKKASDTKIKKKILDIDSDEKDLLIPEEDFEKEIIDPEEAPIEDVPIADIDAAAPMDDDDDFADDEAIDLVPEKKGRGRKKKTDPKAQAQGKFNSMESYIRNRPLQIDVTKPLLKPKKEEQPKPFIGSQDNRTRYSDKELAEFKEIILKKLAEAQSDYEQLKQQINNEDDHGTDDTSPTFKLMEDGSELMTKEELTRLALRQEKYITALKNALIRIENKTYGICRATGKLIPKERLRVVPHATLSIDAKLNQND
jgi:RNA polymerase-binding transcription factor DksA